MAIYFRQNMSCSFKTKSGSIDTANRNKSSQGRKIKSTVFQISLDTNVNRDSSKSYYHTKYDICSADEHPTGSSDFNSNHRVTINEPLMEEEIVHEVDTATSKSILNDHSEKINCGDKIDNQQNRLINEESMYCKRRQPRVAKLVAKAKINILLCPNGTKPTTQKPVSNIDENIPSNVTGANIFVDRGIRQNGTFEETHIGGSSSISTTHNRKRKRDAVKTTSVCKYMKTRSQSRKVSSGECSGENLVSFKELDSSNFSTNMECPNLLTSSPNESSNANYSENIDFADLDIQYDEDSKDSGIGNDEFEGRLEFPVPIDDFQYYETKQDIKLIQSMDVANNLPSSTTLSNAIENLPMICGNELSLPYDPVTSNFLGESLKGDITNSSGVRRKERHANVSHGRMDSEASHSRNSEGLFHNIAMKTDISTNSTFLKSKADNELISPESDESSCDLISNEPATKFIKNKSTERRKSDDRIANNCSPEGISCESTEMVDHYLEGEGQDENDIIIVIQEQDLKEDSNLNNINCVENELIETRPITELVVTQIQKDCDSNRINVDLKSTAPEFIRTERSVLNTDMPDESINEMPHVDLQSPVSQEDLTLNHPEANFGLEDTNLRRNREHSNCPNIIQNVEELVEARDVVQSDALDNTESTNTTNSQLLENIIPTVTPLINGTVDRQPIIYHNELSELQSEQPVSEILTNDQAQGNAIVDTNASLTITGNRSLITNSISEQYTSNQPSVSSNNNEQTVPSMNTSTSFPINSTTESNEQTNGTTSSNANFNSSSNNFSEPSLPRERSVPEVSSHSRNYPSHQTHGTHQQSGLAGAHYVFDASGTYPAYNSFEWPRQRIQRSYDYNDWQTNAGQSSWPSSYTAWAFGSSAWHIWPSDSLSWQNWSAPTSRTRSAEVSACTA